MKGQQNGSLNSSISSTTNNSGKRYHWNPYADSGEHVVSVPAYQQSKTGTTTTVMDHSSNPSRSVSLSPNGSFALPVSPHPPRRGPERNVVPPHHDQTQCPPPPPPPQQGGGQQGDSPLHTPKSCRSMTTMFVATSNSCVETASMVLTDDVRSQASSNTQGSSGADLIAPANSQVVSGGSSSEESHQKLNSSNQRYSQPRNGWAFANTAIPDLQPLVGREQVQPNVLVRQGHTRSRNPSSTNSSTVSTPIVVMTSPNLPHNTSKSSILEQHALLLPPAALADSPHREVEAVEVKKRNASGSETDALATHWINAIRGLSCDAQVDAVVPTLNQTIQLALLDTILLDVHDTIRSDDLFKSLCIEDRGNILVQLLKQLPPWQQQLPCAVSSSSSSSSSPVNHHFHYEAVVRLIRIHWTALSSGQYGSIALTRLLEELPAVPYQQQVAHFALEVADNATLARHPFGNFILRDFLRVASQHPQHFSFLFERLCADLSTPSVFAQLAESRFGSHVLETFLKLAPPTYILNLCSPLLGTPEGIEVAVALGWHRQGNYPLQAVFRALRSPSQHQQHGSTTHSMLLTAIYMSVIPKLQGSNHRRNLVKAAGLDVHTDTPATIATAVGPPPPPAVLQQHQQTMAMPQQLQQYHLNPQTNCASSGTVRFPPHQHSSIVPQLQQPRQQNMNIGAGATGHPTQPLLPPPASSGNMTHQHQQHASSHFAGVRLFK